MNQRRSASGLLAATFSFVCWGLLPLYWKALAGVDALEIVCHRIVWSLACTGLLLCLQGRMGEVRRALGARRHLLPLAAGSVLIAVNWCLYIWAVNAGHVLEASLGYFLNPLVNVVLGMAVFGERLRGPQAVAVGMAAAGVAVRLAGQDGPPWIALVLAGTFGLYGMVRKLVAVESLPGLFVETLVLAAPAAGWLLWLGAHGQGGMGRLGLETDLLLAGAGLVTALPLLTFGFGARRITLTTLGVLQYLSPTGMLLLGVLAFKEPFGPDRAATFGLIWAGVLLYTADGLRRLRASRAPG